MVAFTPVLIALAMWHGFKLYVFYKAYKQGDKAYLCSILLPFFSISLLFVLIANTLAANQSLFLLLFLKALLGITAYFWAQSFYRHFKHYYNVTKE